MRQSFYLESRLVGSFDAAAVPTADGLYRYQPCRGPGHLALHSQLKSLRRPRCCYETQWQRVSFVVVESRSPCVLTLAEFAIEELAAP